jgi:hypothetical protein
MGLIIRTTLNFEGINRVVIRESENQKIYENEKTYVFDIYLNDVLVETSAYYPEYKDYARNELISKWTQVLNSIAK